MNVQKHRLRKWWKEAKHRSRKWLEEAWKGIIGNTAYDLTKWILTLVWLGVATWLIPKIQHSLGAIVPALQNILSTEFVLTVGTIATITPLALGSVTIWSLLTRKRQLEARKLKETTEVELAKRDQQITDLEREVVKQKKLLEISESQIEIASWQLQAATEEKTKVDKLTLALATLSQNVLSLCDEKMERPDELEWGSALETSERAIKCAKGTLYHHVTKVVYCDPSYPVSSWMTREDAEKTRDYFVKRWFLEKNAQQLKDWINKILKNKSAHKSLIVFAQDIVPDTVAEVSNETCLLRRYLNAGGRVVWRGDIPFWYQGKASGAQEEWSDSGPWKILGVYYYNYRIKRKPPQEGQGQIWNSDLPIEITPMGKDIGLTYSGKCKRPVSCENVDSPYVIIRQETFEIIEAAKHGSDGDFALCWKKNFNKCHLHSGFMQYVLGKFSWRDDTISHFFNFAISGWPLFFE